MSLAKSRRRGYESPLREEQQQETRRRLVDAMMEEIQGGASDIVVAAIARRAKVAIPTVYRHFPSRAEMLQAMFERVHELVPPPEDNGDLAHMLRGFFVWRERVAETLGSIGASPLVWELRRSHSVPARRAYVAKIIDERAPGTPEPQRTWLVDLLVVILSDTMASAFRGYLDLDADGTADRVIWAVDALVEAAKKETRKRGKR